MKIKVGGPDIVPEQVVLGGQAEFGVDWLPSLLREPRAGQRPRQHRQVYTRSGTTEVTCKKSGINTMEKMKGKKFGVWIFGNEFEQQAALVKNGHRPEEGRDARQAELRHGRVPEAARSTPRRR